MNKNRKESIRIDYFLYFDNTSIMKNYIKLDKFLLSFGILYLVIPIIIQLFFWYNRWISIPCIFLLIIATIQVIRKLKPLKEEDYKKIFNYKKIIIFAILIIVINILSGAGGLCYQNWDYNFRNTILNDLIEYKWPITYDFSQLAYESSIFGNTGIFNYYFAFWIPGAIIGKLLGFQAASIFMLFWQTIGTMLFFYLIARIMKNLKYRYFFIFISFGGLNVIGHIIMNAYNGLPITPIGVTHIDTSMGVYCMSSFITQLFWVFNQSVPTWIAVMLFLQEKDFKTCGYYFALLIPYAPFPMLGFLYIIFCFILLGKNLDKLINFKRIKELITIPNFFGCMSVLPIVYMFTLNESVKGMRIIDAINNGNLKNNLFSYIMYVLLEFLIYIIIINKKNIKQIIMCFAFFAIVPLFYLGNGADLGNRSTIPLLIFLFLLVIKSLDNINKSDKIQYKKQIILIIILLIASITNFNEIYRSINYTYFNYKNGYSNFANPYKTFATFENKESSQFITNFIIKNDNKNKVLQFLFRR